VFLVLTHTAQSTMKAVVLFFVLLIARAVADTTAPAAGTTDVIKQTSGTTAVQPSASTTLPPGGTTAVVPPAPGTTAMPVPSGTTAFFGTSGIPLSGCEALSGCSSCTGSKDCVWCNSDSVCRSGTWYGASNTCSNWRYQQCTVDGVDLIGIAAAVVAVIILIILICCCVCCCRRKRRQRDRRDQRSKLELEQEQKEALIAREPRKTEAGKRRAELMAKYNIKDKSDVV